MNKQHFTQAMTILGIAYNKEFTTEQVGVWYEFFKDTSIESFKAAIQRIIVKNKYIPSIAELKEEIAIMNNPVLQIDPNDEWDNVMLIIRKYGRYREREALIEMGERNASIVQSIGGMQNICNSNSEQLGWIKKEYISILQNQNTRLENSVKINPNQLTAPELVIKARLATEITNNNLLKG